ncbi:DMT family transporter [Blastococcus brunescens]|uniref:DMT family transporter n=1 Tax=Blastococcus brunescens TaxID=1564165 RepID=A0ABZ1B6R8_9ACTN|nr:DMT family transporter [Blastococcus sp. BMG 8361]WRL66507.1 DMT family transporter [Blastococcus sp. BMG 8361]
MNGTRDPRGQTRRRQFVRSCRQRSSAGTSRPSCAGQLARLDCTAGCRDALGQRLPLVRVTAPAPGPVGVTFARIALGALVLALMVTASCSGVRQRRTWRAIGSQLPAIFLLAALNAAIPLTLVATAIVGLNASLAAVLNATTPMVTLAVAAVWLREPVTARQLLGVAAGVVGVAVLVGGASLELDGTTTLAVAASLLAALCYALGGVYTRTRFADASPTTIALGQQLGATLLLLPVALAAPPPGPYTPALAGILVVLGVGSMALAYVLYFWVIRTAGPVAASAVTLLIPLVGSAIGVGWLGEPLSFSLVAGLVVILTSVLALSVPSNSRRKRPITR